MPRPTIDYLNARREAIRNGRGLSNGCADRIVDPVHVRARDKGRDTIDECHDQVLAIFAEFRSWFAESSRRLAVGNLADDSGTIPF